MANKTNLDFIKIAKWTLWISVVLVIIGLFLVFTRGFSWGVDFAGGTQLRVSFDKEASINQKNLEDAFHKIGLAPSITSVDNPTRDEFLLYYPQAQSNSALVKELLQKLAPSKWMIISENFVGSKIGKQFQRIAFSSTIITLILILIYIAFRFDFRFGVAAVISLLHDIIIVLCFISFIHLTFTIPVLAAILTIVGYSLNDTIVIFDRLRNERRLLDREFLSLKDYYDLVNRSIQKSLTRTFLTAGTTLMVLLIFLFVGGGELKPMALVLTLGVFIGTLSSNFVAPPILYLWHKRDLLQKK